jgi:Lysozyme like domain
MEGDESEMILTPLAVYGFAIQAGFPPVIATSMVAIAKRESAYDSTAHNGNAATGDDSYGLWQINLKDAGIASLLASQGITAANLFEPAVNARAAFLLFGGKVANLNECWYIAHSGTPYQQRYEANLPEAQLAALAYFSGQS